MKNRFRLASAALAVSVAASLVAGCGSGSNVQDNTPATGKVPTKYDNVTLNVLVSSGHQQFAPLWDALPEFTQETGIKVNLIQVGTDQIRQKIMQDFQLGGNSYDVVEVPDDTLAAASKYIEPLDNYFKRDNIDLNAWKQNEAAWSLKAATWDGQLLYYPFYAGSVAGLYREDLFNDPKEQANFKAKYGYDLPNPPTTRQQMEDVAKFFTRPPQMYGIVFPGATETGQNIMENLIFEAGFPYLDGNNNSLWGPKHPENQAPVASEARFAQDMIYTDKVTPPQITSMSSNESSAFYEAGKAAMLMDLIYLPWNQVNSGTVVNTIGKSGSFVIPSADTNKGGIPFYWMRAITKSSKNKDAAWTFLKWVNDPKNLELAMQKGKGVFVPTNLTVADWGVENNKLPKAIVDAVKAAQFYPLNSAIGQARQTMRPLYEKLTLNQITPEQFAQDTGNTIQQVMADAGLAK